MVIVICIFLVKSVDCSYSTIKCDKTELVILIFSFLFLYSPHSPFLNPHLSLNHSTSSQYSLSTPTGDLRLRPAGVGHEVNWSADVGAPDIPYAPEYLSALCQTQPQD